MKAAAAALALAAVASPCQGGAWTKPAGGGQVIIKYEDVTAGTAFDSDGSQVDLLVDRHDRSASVFAEYGISERWTVRLKTDWQSGRDGFVDYEGRGPLELGLAWQAWRSGASAVSLYAGLAEGGEGRNAGYAAPGRGGLDAEVRVAAGRSFKGPTGALGRVAGQGGFAEVQLARLAREDLPDETRLDVTLGLRPSRDWLILAQAYAGAADDGGARWVNLETSAVREFGAWSVQAGWRSAAAGRDTPASQGPVLGLWRRF